MTFTFTEIIVLLIIAGVCGMLGQLISGISRGGVLASIALGFVGALLGAWMARAMQLPEPFPIQVGEAVFPTVWSIIGSAIFLVVLTVVRNLATRHD